MLDGAMGTMIQELKLDEDGYRGARFDAWNREVRGNNDLLNPDAARRDPRHPSRLFPRRRRHRLDQHVLLDHDRAGRLRHGGHRLRAQPRGRAARARGGRSRAGRRRPPALRRRRARPDQPHRLDLARRVAIPASAPSPSTSCARPMASRCDGLIDGGADLLLIETIFDTLNAKAAIYAIAEVCEARGVRPAGDDLRHHHRPLGPPAVRPDAGSVLEFGAPCQRRSRSGSTARSAPRRCARISPRLGRVADTLVCAYPNAGLPNEFGGYDESPEYMAELLGEFAAPAWSTSSAAAAAPRPSISRAIARGGRGQGAARHSGNAAACCGCPAWSRSR